MTFRQLVNEMIRDFPPSKHVHVRRVITDTGENGNPLLGECIEYDDRFEILIDRTSCHRCQRENLVHEYAHVLSGWEDGEETHHDKWGIEFARLTRWMLEK